MCRYHSKLYYDSGNALLLMGLLCQFSGVLIKKDEESADTGRHTKIEMMHLGSYLLIINGLVCTASP